MICGYERAYNIKHCHTTVTYSVRFFLFCIFSGGTSLSIRELTTSTPNPICYVCGATPKQVLHIKHLSTQDMCNRAVH